MTEINETPNLEIPPIESPTVETPGPEYPPNPAPRRRRLGMIVGFSLLGVLLLVAAFLGGRLLNGQGGNGLTLGVPGGPLGSSPVMSSIRIEKGEPPEELPRTQPELSGQFVKRSDNLLYLGSLLSLTGTGAVSVVAAEGSSQGGNILSIPTPSGPLTEVVVTKDTKIYRDSTFDDLKGGPIGTDTVVQQKVTEASLDEIGESSFVTVWGRKNGDRVIADVLMFTSPVVFSSGK